MFKPSYHLTTEAILLISEISEQVGILETLTENEEKVPEENVDPFLEDNLLSARTERWNRTVQN